MKSYVRNAWYVACWEKDLARETPYAMTILNERLVLWRTAADNLHALEDRCAHRLAALSLGRCEGERLRCMYHGMLFDPDGSVVEIPGQSQLPPHACVRSYPVVARDSWIWIWMGDAAVADPDLIPSVIGFDNPGYMLGGGQLDYATEARLINDNLLDFSHLSFVHASSFALGMTFADQVPRITKLPRGVRNERWLLAPGGPDDPAQPPVDTWQAYDYLIPGILILWVGTYPAGTAERLGFGRPSPEEATGFFNVSCQAVTPMTDRTTRYFFSAGVKRGYGGEAERDAFVETTRVAFAEDKVMIEEQQRVIDATANPVVTPTAHDKGVILFNRLVKKLVDQERSGEKERVAA